MWANEACLLRPDRPFYVPDWDSNFCWIPMLALRSSRVGKSIPARFAGRYVTQVSVWLQAVGLDTLRQLRDRGLPQASAVSFDYSLASAPFQEMNLEEASQLRALLRTGDREVALNAASCPPPAETFAAISRRNTVRTGDLLLLPFGCDPLPIIPGCKVSITMTAPSEAELLRFQTK